MKYQVYRAVDSIDMTMCWFTFDDNGNHSCLVSTLFDLDEVVQIISDRGCILPNSTRRDDMINPVLVMEFEA